MTLEAAYLEHSTPGDEVEDVTVFDLNPFGLKGEKDRMLLIRKNGVPVFLLQLYIRADDDGWLIGSAFSEFLLNATHVAIICGDHFHIFDLVTHSFRSHPLGDYAGHIYSVPDVNSARLHERVLVATYGHVLLIDIHAGIVWKSSRCAIDGVVITSIVNDRVLGQGEWDPPGGWKPFQLNFETGIHLRGEP